MGKRLDAEIGAESSDAEALSHEARQQREAEVMAICLRSSVTKAFLCGRRGHKVCRASIAATSARSRSCSAGWSRHRVQSRRLDRRRSMPSAWSGRDDEIVQPRGACQLPPRHARARGPAGGLLPRHHYHQTALPRTARRRAGKAARRRRPPCHGGVPRSECSAQPTATVTSRFHVASGLDASEQGHPAQAVRSTNRYATTAWPASR